MSEKLDRPVARMPGLTALIEDQNKAITTLQGGFSSFQEYSRWILTAASLCLGKWPPKGENIFENRHVAEMIIRDSKEYDPDMAERLLFELSKMLIDIYQDAQASVLQKLAEEDTTDRVQRRKMEGIH
ncbi:MAG: hypothetical protein ACYCT2_04460 [Thermoplasmataceae archaeon]